MRVISGKQLNAYLPFGPLGIKRCWHIKPLPCVVEIVMRHFIIIIWCKKINAVLYIIGLAVQFKYIHVVLILVNVMVYAIGKYQKRYYIFNQNRGKWKNEVSKYAKVFGSSLKFYIGKWLSDWHETFITRMLIGFPSPIVHHIR